MTPIGIGVVVGYAILRWETMIEAIDHLEPTNHPCDVLVGSECRAFHPLQLSRV